MTDIKSKGFVNRFFINYLGKRPANSLCKSLNWSGHQQRDIRLEGEVANIGPPFHGLGPIQSPKLIPRPNQYCF